MQTERMAKNRKNNIQVAREKTYSKLAQAKEQRKSLLIIPGKTVRFSERPDAVLDWLESEGVQHEVFLGKGTEVNLSVKD